MCCHSVAYGTEVLNDNFSCTWTLCSTQSGDGWPQRSQLQPGVPSLGRCITLLPATFCNLGLGDPLSSSNKRIVFISYSFLLGKPAVATISNSARQLSSTARPEGAHTVSCQMRGRNCRRLSYAEPSAVSNAIDYAKH